MTHRRDKNNKSSKNNILDNGKQDNISWLKATIRAMLEHFGQLVLGSDPPAKPEISAFIDLAGLMVKLEQPGKVANEPIDPSAETILSPVDIVLIENFIRRQRPALPQDIQSET